MVRRFIVRLIFPLLYYKFKLGNFDEKNMKFVISYRREGNMCITIIHKIRNTNIEIK
jgi:hypothetical protein